MTAKPIDRDSWLAGWDAAVRVLRAGTRFHAEAPLSAEHCEYAADLLTISRSIHAPPAPQSPERRPFEALDGEPTCPCSADVPYRLREGHSCACWGQEDESLMFAPESRGLWRCSCCGEALATGAVSSEWRWNGTAWEHTHADYPQAGHFEARFFSTGEDQR